MVKVITEEEMDASAESWSEDWKGEKVCSGIIKTEREGNVAV